MMPEPRDLEALDGAVLGLLGLARRAGALVIGMDRMRLAVKRGQGLLLLADPALSHRTWRELEEWRDKDDRNRLVAVAGLADLNGTLGTRGVRALGLADGGFRRGVEERLGPPKTGEQGGCQEA